MAAVGDFEHYTATREQVEQAHNIAIRKEPHINVYSPGGTRRPPHKVRTNIFHGGIAQFAVEHVLRRHIATRVEIYDLIRTDDFRRFDPWDLQTEIHSHQRAVEVRSSYVERKCLGLAGIPQILDCIQQQYSLLASYSTSNKLGELPKSLFFQVYWTYTQTDAESLYREVEAGRRDAINCYVVGFATRKLLQDSGRTSSLGQQGASYKLVSISDSFPCKDLATVKDKELDEQ